MNVRDRILGAIGWLGPALLFATACVYGMLEVHPSTDTWIGLAAGKEIVSLGRVPIVDSFSFTFAGQPWYNQNWGTHWIQYQVYSGLGADSVICLTWLIVAAIAFLVFLACYWRTGSLLGSLIAASAVAFGLREFVSARPATTGFLCMAVLAALLAALDGQDSRKRWWPIICLLPLMLAWGTVHGSFTFGYGLIGLFVAHAVVMSRLRPESVALDRAQLAATAGVTVLALLLTILLGPFGIENFIHGEKVAGSHVFRAVAEWKSPLQSGGFPGMWRFWLISALALAALGIAALGAFLSRRASKSTPANVPPRRSSPLHESLFDYGVLSIGLVMTLWARRFAPIALIFGAPIILTWVLLIGHSASQSFKRNVIGLVMAASWLVAAALAWETIRTVRAELIEPYLEDSSVNLLERVTRYAATPQDAIDYLRENELRVNLFVEWSEAGAVMLHAPLAKVFIDGRAQQVYDERTYMTYVNLVSPKTTMQTARDMLGQPDLAKVDAFLLRPGKAEALAQTLLSSPEWQLTFSSGNAILLLRRGSDGLRQVEQLLRENREVRPDSGGAWFARGELLRNMSPPDTERALASYVRSVELSPALGFKVYSRVWEILDGHGRYEDARRLVSSQREMLKRYPPGLLEGDRQGLLSELERLDRLIDQRMRSAKVPTA